MGITAGLTWREAVAGEDDEDDDTESGGPPAFTDAKQWAYWLTRLTEGRDRDLVAVGCGALTACYVQEMDVDEVEWVTPQELRAAAERLIALVRADHPDVAGAVQDYLDGDAGVSYPPGQENLYLTTESLLADLDTAIQMATWAVDNGKEAVAFECG